MENLVMCCLSALSTILLILLRKRKYNINWGEVLIVIFVIGIIGYVGASLGSYLSYGSWLGIRFYGKALVVTAALLVIAKICKKSNSIMDFYAPIDICALIIMKVNCLRADCCSGIELYVNKSGEIVRFPSQLAELVVAILIFLLVLCLEIKAKCNGYRYYIYLLAYGSTRLVFDFFRSDPGKAISVVAVDISVTKLICIFLALIGIVGICISKKQENAKMI